MYIIGKRALIYETALTFLF